MKPEKTVIPEDAKAENPTQQTNPNRREFLKILATIGTTVACTAGAVALSSKIASAWGGPLKPSPERMGHTEFKDIELIDDQILKMVDSGEKIIILAGGEWCYNCKTALKYLSDHNLGPFKAYYLTAHEKTPGPKQTALNKSLSESGLIFGMDIQALPFLLVIDRHDKEKQEMRHETVVYKGYDLYQCTEDFMAWLNTNYPINKTSQQTPKIERPGYTRFEKIDYIDTALLKQLDKGEMMALLIENNEKSEPGNILEYWKKHNIGPFKTLRLDVKNEAILQNLHQSGLIYGMEMSDRPVLLIIRRSDFTNQKYRHQFIIHKAIGEQESTTALAKWLDQNGY